MTTKITTNMSLQEKVKNLPHRPGCYIYKNAQGQVIYVGKAKDLRKRVTTYFTKTHDFKTTRLLKEITDLEYFVVTNEKEALLLEDNLIKKYRPKFNVLLNDDRAYPYIIVTNEKNPEYKYVRRYDKKALKSYGPLPIGSGARQLLITLQRVFPLRRCKGNLGKPCLYYHLGQCSGACFKEVPWNYYEEKLKPLSQFFKGNTREVHELLTNKMEQAANNLQFEEAQRMKDLLRSLQLAEKTNHVELHDKVNRDILAFSLASDLLAITLLFYRGGKLLMKDEFLMAYNEQEIEDLVGSYLAQIYKRNMLPDQLILPEDLAFEFLDSSFKRIATAPITRVEQRLYQLAQSNANESLRQGLLNAQTVHHQEQKVLEELQTIANLSRYPHHLEMYDIANFGNKIVVGSQVVYKEGKPDRNAFRKYNIDLAIPDDIHRLESMLYRRFQSALVKQGPLPDLVIIDGGMTHVHFARRLLASLDLEKVPVIGLVKDQHHNTNQLITTNDTVITLDRHTPLYNFLSAIQIRVDAFAKLGLHQKQKQKFATSPLLNINGLGPKKVQELYKRFPTIYEMAKATPEELNGIVKNRATTEHLLAFLATINV
ncbi:excinuclease ABC subunit C [Entomoplasma freundtii]|uniref:UvrABC system protein C n=1 Tax=Entomoplasma freundtii TaxID=74700 RepID=A0A2K8NSM2_9MOLU|nr:excinuclease ABC subunit UvrC [Entomoplasma freundtii]ATZ16556.1 excinuclease ABC subunit C [Entomoplasma freundtii]TDY58278.1 excinuclease ABC subunit C [Entomoplasma freundtii]